MSRTFNYDLSAKRRRGPNFSSRPSDQSILGGFLEPESLKKNDKAKLKFSSKLEKNFQFAIGELSVRGLSQATKWLCELHTSLESSILLSNAERDFEPNHNKNGASPYDIYDGDVIKDFQDNFSHPDSPNYSSAKYYRAKALFDTQEFGKAYVFLSKHGPKDSNLLRFLRLYSHFIAGESHTHNPNQDIIGRLSEDSPKPNLSLELIWDELYPLFQQNRSNMEEDAHRLDPFCLYLLGVVAGKSGRNTVAQEALLNSIKLFPYNWSAWVELGKSVKSQTEYSAIIEQVPSCILREFFWMHMDPGFNLSQDQLDLHANVLIGLFPHSQTVILQKALAYYHYTDYALALQLFESAFEEDAYLLDYADVFAHILFILKDNKKLCRFAERCVKLDPLRPETCCVVGNFYALENDFGKALSYFSNAIKFDGRFQSAWLLAGQCFTELQNLSTAISSYSRATSLKPNDYRAWGALANVYELLGMPNEAIFHYSKAASINPNDARIWHSLGDLYLVQKKYHEAASCFENCPPDYVGACEIHLKLGELYELFLACDSDEKFRIKAALYYRKGIAELDPNVPYKIKETKALYFLAEFELLRNDLVAARGYCSEALQSKHDRQRVEKLSQEIDSRLQGDLI